MISHPRITQAETLQPPSSEAVGAILRAANAEGREVSTSKAARANALRLDLRGLKAIEQYDPGDLTIRVQAGARVQDVLAVLAQHRQMLPWDMPGAQENGATIGGVLASAAHGPMRASFGGVREYCIGMQFATADGTLAQSGGMVVKNVAGYDLMKLLIGSRGTLGIITSANFKVFPLPRRSSTFVAEFGSSGEAIKFAQTVRRSALTPLRLELASPGSAAHIHRWSILTTVAGSQTIIERYRRELSNAVPELLELTAEEDAAVWRALNDVYWSSFISDGPALIVDVSSTMVSTGAACKAIQDAANRTKSHVTIHGRAGIGNLIGIFHPDCGAGPCEILAHLRRTMPPDAFVHVVYPRTAIDVSQNIGMQIVKRALDPKNILNPGAATL
ncbi:MAG: FAD-binding oxidoreductase [Acidobacteriaceae bacterium]